MCQIESSSCLSPYSLLFSQYLVFTTKQIFSNSHFLQLSILILIHWLCRSTIFFTQSRTEIDIRHATLNSCSIWKWDTLRLNLNIKVDQHDDCIYLHIEQSYNVLWVVNCSCSSLLFNSWHIEFVSRLVNLECLI